MKVAILTTHRANNFGAMLQAYSLVNFCREQGVNAEIFDWRTSLFERQYRSAFRVSRNPMSTLRYLYWYYCNEREARRRFDEFRRLLPMSRPYTSVWQLRGAEDAYDAFIVGSDQVWNPQQTSPCDPLQFDRTYLMNFVRHKLKFAYADSIGKPLIQPESIVPEYIEAWKTYAGISMREQAGADFVSRRIGKEVPVVVDPVFLHDAMYWRGNESGDMHPGKYVLIYNVQHYRSESKWMIQQAYKYAAAIGAQVFNILVPGAPRSKIENDNLSVGPRDFLRLIDGAAGVFTNSFHATAFAVIFKKKLFLHKAEAPGTTNTRFDFLSSWCGKELQVYANNGCDKILFFNCDQSMPELEAMQRASKALLCKWMKV